MIFWVSRRKYSSKSNLIAKLVKSTDAEFGVANIVILGKSEATEALARRNMGVKRRMLPFAGTSRGINNSLGSFNLAKTCRICSESFIISVWVKATNVNVAIAEDGV